MSTIPAPAPAALASSEPLLTLFCQQLSWLINGAQEAKRVFTRHLLRIPPAPGALPELLASTREVTVRHMTQLEQLIGDEWNCASEEPARAMTVLLSEIEAAVNTSGSTTLREQAFRQAVQQICSCFVTACTSAAETALALARIDLVTVLASWAAAWRALGAALTPALRARA